MILFRSLICLMIATGYIAAQKNDYGVIKGKVTDASSFQPLQDVNVYIVNSVIGSATNNSGYFEIKNLLPGKYRLIVSSIGFYHIIKEVKLEPAENVSYTFRLHRKVYELPTVNILDEKDDEWQDNFEIFRRELLGETENAENTQILNPFIINFSENERGNLVASAREPLEVVNNSLGYSIIYFLEYFEYDDIGSVRYAGNPVFRELSAVDDELNSEWSERRLSTYLGSFRHFLKTISDNFALVNKDRLYDGTLGKIDGNEIKKFLILHYFVPPWENNSYNYRLQVNINSFLSEGVIDNELKISFKDYLSVRYDLGDRNYLESTIKLHADTVYFDKGGRYNDEFKIQRFGHWATQRLADMLPLDYVPTKN